MEENIEINEKKTWTDPVTGKFIKGNPGGGRPQGSLDFKTKWFKAIEKIAKQNELTPEDIEQQLLLVGYKKAKDGDYSFYRDILDRIYGKPIQTTINDTNISGSLDNNIVILPEKNNHGT